MPYYGFYDWTYFLVLIGAVISMFASENNLCEIWKSKKPQRNDSDGCGKKNS